MNSYEQFYSIVVFVCLIPAWYLAKWLYYRYWYRPKPLKTPERVTPKPESVIDVPAVDPMDPRDATTRLVQAREQLK